MSDQQAESNYLAMRAAECERMAAHSTQRGTATIHLRMADEYRRRAMAIDRPPNLAH